VLKFLADVSHSPVSEVFSLWRIPVWEELIVFAAIAALWLALLLFGAIVPACMRIINDPGVPTLFGFFAAGYLLFDIFLIMVMYSHGNESFLPYIMAITTSASTAILASGLAAWLLCAAASSRGSSPREGVAAGYGFLMG